MPAQPTGFVKERLIEARESRGFNQTQLAEIADIARQAVSKYEQGERTPTLEVLNSIAQALRFPIHRFSMPMPERNPAPVFFRSYASATKSARRRALRMLEWVACDFMDYVRKFVEIPAVHYPKIDVPDDPLLISDDAIEEHATSVRRLWGLGDGPISDLTLLLENNGTVIVQQDLESTKLDAFSCWDTDSDRPYFVIGTNTGSAVRSRMNAAHELGHMILHRNLRPGLVARKDIHGLLEHQAWHFAGCFLLPRESFLTEVPYASLKLFATLKPRWRVAIQAMIVRAKSLEIVSESEAERLFVYLSQRGWRKKEPFDDELPIESPRLMERGFNLILDNDLATKLSIESDIGIYAGDIERSAGLPQGFFDGSDAASRFTGLKLVRTDQPTRFAT